MEKEEGSVVYMERCVLDELCYCFLLFVKLVVLISFATSGQCF